MTARDDHTPIVIVGGGLAGLSCAVRLHRAGCAVRLLEASDDVGGRVRTDVVDGFTIDRGFQVLNTAYPALRRAVDLDSLQLRSLPRGVRIRRGGRLHDVPHPLSSPTAPLRALGSGAASPLDKLALARYAASLLTSADAIKRRPDLPAQEAWAQALPDGLAAEVLTPFLSGVVLENPVRTSRVFTDLMMRMFATGSSAVPARGMHALPRRLAAQLPPTSVELDTPVAEVRADTVVLKDGTAIPARAVVVATDPWTAHDLLPGLGSPPEARGVVTHYFAAAPWQGSDGTLVVDADGSGVLNSVVLTASAPEYSADGRALIATSLLHEGGTDVAVDRVREIATDLHEAPGSDWEHVATRTIPDALPAMPAPHPLRRPVRDTDTGVWVAGDHRDTSSIQGALVSGTRAAAAVLRQAGDGRRAA